MFPEGYFYILSRMHGFALDVYNGQTTEDTNIIVWPQKFQDSENQLWSYEKGRLINKKSGLAMDITSSFLKSDKYVAQKKPKPTKQSQEWVYDQGFICSKEFPNLVLDIRGDSTKSGAEVLLYKRKETDNLNQLWQIEPHQQFEGSLGLATQSVPLHKKDNFGVPRPGYAAEVGVPSELTQIPQDSKIAGIGNTPTPTTTNSGNSRNDPVLAQYGSFYGGSTTTNPPPQQGQAPSANTYNNQQPYYQESAPNYPPQQYAFPQPGGAYNQQAPPPMPIPDVYNSYPPPQQQQQQQTDQYGYPINPQ